MDTNQNDFQCYYRLALILQESCSPSEAQFYKWKSRVTIQEGVEKGERESEGGRDEVNEREATPLIYCVI